MPQLPKFNKPRLVNRGPAGLLSKKPQQAPSQSRNNTPISGRELWEQSPKDSIAESLSDLIVDIDSLTLDPQNARVHPDRNMAAIKDSLCLYGQTSPLIVRRETMTIVAGNGRWQSMKELGWTKVAASIQSMTDADAIGYGLADNRTAELAKWDFEIVARLDKLLQEAKVCPVGWSQDELDVLRAADWEPVPISESNGDGNGQRADGHLLVGFSQDQYDGIVPALTKIRQGSDRDLDQAECLAEICKSWLEMVESGEGRGTE